MPDTPLSVSVPASITAGFVARVLCHPIDTMKARIQAAPSAPSLPGSVIQATRQAIRSGGVASLYQGLPAAALGSAPAVCIYIGSFEQFRAHLMKRPLCIKYPSLADFWGGMGAETLSCIIFVPVDVIKERMQVQVKGAPSAYHSAGHALRTILRDEGVRGIYKGYGATLLSFGPFSACYFLFYEQCKRAFRDMEHTKQLTVLQSLTCSASAGALASVLTNPLDLVKLRLQIQRYKGASYTGVAYRGVFHALTSVATTSGFRGLWRGAGARVAFHVPNTAITFAVYERCKHYLLGETAS